MAEDVGQHIGGGDLTDYLGQVGETLAQVLGYEVCAYSALQALYGAQQVGMGKVKGLLMSDVADKYGGCVVARSFGCIDELLLQPWQACAVDGLKGGGLILDADDGLVLACGQGGVGYPRLGHHDNDACLGSSSGGALYAYLLYAVGGVAQSSGIDKAEEDASEGGGVLYKVAGGAALRTDDGSVIAYQCIEQGRLAYIGCPDDGYAHSLLKGIAGGKGGSETAYLCGGLSGQGQQFMAIGKLQVFVVGKVQLQLQQAGKLQEPVAQLA